MLSIHSDPLTKIGSIEAGGQNLYVKGLTRELDALGWSVDVFTRNDNPTKRAVVKIGKRSRVIRIVAGPKRFIPKNVVFRYLPDFIKNFLVWRAREHNSYALVHGNYYEAGWVAMQLKRILDLPMVQTFHSLGIVRYHTLLRYREQPIDSEEFRFRTRVENEIMETSDAIIATSPMELEYMKLLYGLDQERSAVIPVGIDHHVFRAIPRPQATAYVRKRFPRLMGRDAVVVLYVGRIEWRKGLGTLIIALRELLRFAPSLASTLELVVIGSDKERQGKRMRDTREVKRLKALARDHKVSRFLYFIGSVPQDDLSYFYSAATVVAVPSYYEPFGIVPVEAMLSKVPVVASRTGGLQYTVKDGITGLLVDPHKPRPLARALYRIIAHPKLAERLARHAYNRVKEKFTWVKVGPKVAEFYESLIREYGEKY